MATQVGQSMTLTLVITPEDGGEEADPATYTIDLPYNMDGIVINLPAYLEGLPEEAYLTEFVPLVTEEPEEEIDLGGDMGLGDF